MYSTAILVLLVDYYSHLYAVCTVLNMSMKKWRCKITQKWEVLPTWERFDSYAQLEQLSVDIICHISAQQISNLRHPPPAGSQNRPPSICTSTYSSVKVDKWYRRVPEVGSPGSRKSEEVGSRKIIFRERSKNVPNWRYTGIFTLPPKGELFWKRKQHSFWSLMRSLHHQ